MEGRAFPMRPPPPSGGPQPAFPRGHSSMLMGMGNKKLPEIFFYNFDDTKGEFKWRNPRVDITDYFNYGFNEEAWRIYADKVIKLASKVEGFIQDHGDCAVLNDRLPLEFGGFGPAHFEKVRNLPFIGVLNRNKERFFYQHHYEKQELRNQFHNALTSEQFIEENYREVRSCYDPIVSDTLLLKKKLPEPSMGPMMMMDRPRLPPMLPPRQESRPAPIPPVQPIQPQLTKSQLQEVILMLNKHQQPPPRKPSPSSSEEDRKDSRRNRRRKDSEDSDKSIAKRKTTRRSRDRERERGRDSSGSRDKKKKKSSRDDRHREESRKKSKEREKDRVKDRDKDREKDRELKHKGRDKERDREPKQKEKDKEHTRDKDQPSTPNRSAKHSPKKKDVPVISVKDKKEVADIRQRIQPRK